MFIYTFFFCILNCSSQKEEGSDLYNVRETTSWKWVTYSIMQRKIPGKNGTWACDLWDCTTHCSTIRAINIWELGKCNFVPHTEDNKYLYICNWCEMWSWAAEFEIVDDLTNIIHLHNVTLHELYFSSGEIPIKTKIVAFFSLYKDMS